MAFGHRYCEAFIAAKRDFSAFGQAWLENVRACLQKALLDRITAPPSRNVTGAGRFQTCRELSDFAFETHPLCYASPVASACPSWAGLTLHDYWLVIRTIRE